MRGLSLEAFEDAYGPAVRLLHLLPPRAAIVQVDPAVLARLTADQRVEFALSKADPVPEQLTEAELMFVAAWRRASAKARGAGDGLEWGANGFEAP